MEYKSSEVKAGFFIIMSLLVLILMVFALGNIQDYFRPKKELQIIFNFTGGLEAGAPVRYAGLDVGKVVDIRLLDPSEDKETDRVTVVTQIVPSIKLKENSTASIKTSGLMGGLYIDIRPGTKASPPLPDNVPLLGQDSFEFAKIGDLMGEVVAQTQRFIDLADALIVDSRETLKAVQVSLKSVNHLVNDNKDVLTSTLGNLETITLELTQILKGKGKVIGETIDHIAATAEKTDKLLGEKSVALAGIIDQTYRMTREMEILLADTRPGITNLVSTLETDTRKISATIDSTSVKFDETLDQSSAMISENRRTFMELLNNLNETSRNLKALTGDVKRNPWKLVRKSDEAPPEPDKPGLPTGSPGQIRIKRLDKVPNP